MIAERLLERTPRDVLARIDALWIEAAKRLGIPVARDDDFGYVHWDGRTLHLATDAELDADDTVAQLVLHEICHAITQGAARMEHLATADWGLDNTTNEDEAREYAALRLQAHLLGAFGLRDLLFPTTVVKPFYVALPGPEGGGAIEGDSLPGPDDPSRPLARMAARLAATLPWRPVLHEALEETARLCGLPRHPSGAVLAEGQLSCGGCAFRSPGGLCRKAGRRLFVDAAERACVRFEPRPDCLACGACCRSAYDTVLVAPRARVVTHHPELIERVDGLVRLRRSGDRCAALAGPPGGPFHCVVYDDRPATCRQFENAGAHCLTARRKVGLSV